MRAFGTPSVSFRRSLDVVLKAELRLLTDFAADHIEDVAVVDFVLDAFIDVLGVYADEWSPFDVTLTYELLPSFLSGEEGPIDAVATNSVRLAKAAMTGSHEQALASIVYMPSRIIRLAAEKSAPGYIRSMRSFSNAIIHLTTRPGWTRLAQQTRARVWESLTESLTYQLRPSAHPGVALSDLRVEVRISLIETLRQLMIAGDIENLKRATSVAGGRARRQGRCGRRRRNRTARPDAMAALGPARGGSGQALTARQVARTAALDRRNPGADGRGRDYLGVWLRVGEPGQVGGPDVLGTRGPRLA